MCTRISCIHRTCIWCMHDTCMIYACTCKNHDPRSKKPCKIFNTCPLSKSLGVLKSWKLVLSNSFVTCKFRSAVLVEKTEFVRKSTNIFLRYLVLIYEIHQICLKFQQICKIWTFHCTGFCSPTQNLDFHQISKSGSLNC